MSKPDPFMPVRCMREVKIEEHQDYDFNTELEVILERETTRTSRSSAKSTWTPET